MYHKILLPGKLNFVRVDVDGDDALAGEGKLGVDL